jgi:hypothetical protein
MKYITNQDAIEAEVYVNGMKTEVRGLCYCTMMMGRAHVHGETGAKAPLEGDD